MTHPPRFVLRATAVAGLLFGCAFTAQPADVVVMKDGFLIQGNVRKEMESVNDRGNPVTIFKASGFDFVDDGVRTVVFSSHHKQLGEIAKDAKLRPEYKAYLNPFGTRVSVHPLPAMGGAQEVPDFNDNWKRTIKVHLPPNDFDKIAQQITYLDPYCCFMVSQTHLWSQSFRTTEMDPRQIRKLLSTHPDLIEKDGKADPVKRIAIARFMKDVGWIHLAKEEVDRLKKEVPAPLSKEARELLDKLNKEIDGATAELVVNEAEKSLLAGRYRYTADLLAAFPDKTAEPRDVDRATKLMAQVKTSREQYDTGRRLLRGLIDDATGGAGAKPYLAIGGGPVAAVFPSKAGPGPLASLCDAAEIVYAELHPDSAGRIEFFVNLAAQVEREKGMGQPGSKRPDELLATAISGWAKGKNGAAPDPKLALRIWGAREMVLQYQRAATLNERNNVLGRYKKNPDTPVALDELTQIISLLPPAESENLLLRTGTPVKPGNGVPEGVFKRRSAPYGQHPAGLDYYVKLPPEYHHGRAYPIIVALTYPDLDAEKFIGGISSDADKNGYIVIAPDWVPKFGAKTGWNWDAADHDWVTASLRDAIRHFTVDTDRVYLIGGGAGADMAMDVGSSHPDLFAGVVAVAPHPKWTGHFEFYWKNAQKLPFYIVNGELSGDSNGKLRRIFDFWMPNGFPALDVIYRGRGVEWFPAEIPVMFDWLGRKKRANGTSTLQLGSARHRWQTMREEDNRFYWLGVEKIHPGNLLANVPAGRTVIPANLIGDIKGNNLIDLHSIGVRKVSVWLGRDMIDWSKPVRVSMNGAAALGWKPRIVEQDIQVLLDDYWHRGDRRMLYLARLEFSNAN